MTITEKLEKLKALRPLSPEAVASLSAAWDTKMVYESNSIEGNSLTLRETDLVLAKGITVSGKPLKDHLEAVNLAEAWQYVKSLVSKAGTDLRAVRNEHTTDGSESHPCLTERDVLELHRMVLDKIQNMHAGSYRTSSVRISGANHVPPNPIKVPDLMTELFSRLEKITDPFIKAATLHHGIAHIHPFSDGNGRTARLAMNFILLAAGYPPISISPEKRNEYYAALEQADHENFTPYISFLETQLHQELDYYFTALEEKWWNVEK